MPNPSSGDGARAPVPLEPDAHGQAALLLAESTLHMLVERGVVTAGEAIDVVGAAADVKLEIATAAGESAARMNASLDLLRRISQSFAVDGDGHDPRVGGPGSRP